LSHLSHAFLQFFALAAGGHQKIFKDHLALEKKPARYFIISAQMQQYIIYGTINRPHLSAARPQCPALSGVP